MFVDGKNNERFIKLETKTHHSNSKQTPNKILSKFLVYTLQSQQFDYFQLFTVKYGRNKLIIRFKYMKYEKKYFQLNLPETTKHSNGGRQKTNFLLIFLEISQYTNFQIYFHYYYFDKQTMYLLLKLILKNNLINFYFNKIAHN